jgi:hypothetical protein
LAVRSGTAVQVDSTTAERPIVIHLSANSLRIAVVICCRPDFEQPGNRDVPPSRGNFATAPSHVDYLLETFRCACESFDDVRTVVLWRSARFHSGCGLPERSAPGDLRYFS